MDGKASSSLVPLYGEDEATGGAAVADGLSSDQKWRSNSGRRQQTRSAGDVPHATAPTSSWSILVAVAPLLHLELHRDQDTHHGDLVRSLVIIWSITEDTAGSEIREREGAASRVHVKRK
ncbi:hypothetical protein ZWY2020_025535 [Hordeum vulgare]|nr:hypothetical protein ZWY2020_025535 [Hordeum vulgare]